jgi:pimeloyl-ACP methyl ester carboxylesterase
MVDGRQVRVREVGEDGGFTVVHFHGTPGSRLDLDWADELVEAHRVRLITFDRPGYGRSEPSPFSLSSIAGLTLEICDRLGVSRFAAMGMSGGGPFALATAAELPERVSAVGVASGPGPLQEVPGGLGELSAADTEGISYLPGDPARAVETIAADLPDIASVNDAAALFEMFEPLLSDRDKAVFRNQDLAEAFLRSAREAVRNGNYGYGWDNVSWLGKWDFDVESVRCPVLLWYGTEDLMAPPVHARWLAEHLPDARMTMREGYGHLAIFEHLPEMLEQLRAV